MSNIVWVGNEWPSAPSVQQIRSRTSSTHSVMVTPSHHDGRTVVTIFFVREDATMYVHGAVREHLNRANSFGRVDVLRDA